MNYILDWNEGGRNDNRKLITEMNWKSRREK